nr:hypothetical protein [Paracoccus shandongensis]
MAVWLDSAPARATGPFEKARRQAATKSALRTVRRDRKETLGVICPSAASGQMACSSGSDSVQLATGMSRGWSILAAALARRRNSWDDDPISKLKM